MAVSLSHMCWELNPDPLKKQGPSFQLPLLEFSKKKFIIGMSKHLEFALLQTPLCNHHTGISDALSQAGKNWHQDVPQNPGVHT